VAKSKKQKVDIPEAVQISENIFSIRTTYRNDRCFVSRNDEGHWIWLGGKRGVRSAERGVRSAECGVRSAECGVFCLRLQTILISDSAFSTEPGGSVENAESV
jgi:hypothetical protein